MGQEPSAKKGVFGISASKMRVQTGSKYLLAVIVSLSRSQQVAKWKGGLGNILRAATQRHCPLRLLLPAFWLAVN